MTISVARTTRLVSAILLCVIACADASARQSGQRVISQAPAEAGRRSPVEVVAVKVKGALAAPGRPFAAGDDWLSSLTFSLKNISDKPISYVEISLRFPSAAGHKAKSVQITGPIAYGCFPGYPCRLDTAGSSTEILPGETREVGVRDSSENLTATLAQLGVSLPVLSAEYDIDSVLFDADTKWSRGLLFKRDPSEPNTFRMAGKYVLPGSPE